MSKNQSQSLCPIPHYIHTVNFILTEVLLKSIFLMKENFSLEVTFPNTVHVFNILKLFSDEIVNGHPVYIKFTL